MMNSNAMENTTSSPTGGVSGRPFTDKPVDMPDGSKYQGFRYQGVFSKNMDLHRFPFDIQQLTVFLEDVNQDTRALVFVPDTTPVTINEQMTIPGFGIGTPTLTVMPHQYPANFRDLTAPPNPSYSRFMLAVVHTSNGQCRASDPSRSHYDHRGWATAWKPPPPWHRPVPPIRARCKAATSDAERCAAARHRPS
ncbi:hypothetical protein [Mycolicibacterium sp.]|uniref:hypothetical protein n=1 Tax=Mycolicibacterium sp. TaxID=2320850 RepID=UPI0028A73C28|nr:hypothetical protein [Mycolicibacterium sp.]